MQQPTARAAAHRDQSAQSASLDLVTKADKDEQHLVSRINGVLAGDPSWTGRALEESDLAMMLDHFHRWLLTANRTSPSAPEVTTYQLIEAVSFLVSRGPTLSLHPRAVRAAATRTVASRIGTTPEAVGAVWAWWESSGSSLFAPPNP